MAAGGAAAGGVQYAFGRHLSPEGARAADLRFTFEREPQGGDGCTTPYWQQGNASFDKTLPAKQRAALASDRRHEPALKQHAEERGGLTAHHDALVAREAENGEFVN